MPSQAPAPLRDLRAWLVWRFEHVAAEAKPRKVPYYAGGGRRHGVQGRPEDRAQMVTFEAARAVASRRGFDGVGLALFADSNIVALDFDRCVSPEGVIVPEVAALVAGTYAELSPSGQGVRAFFAGQMGNGKSHDGPYGFESFSDKGFVTITGNALGSTELLGLRDTVAPVTEAVRALYRSRFGKAERAATTTDTDLAWLESFEPPVGMDEAQIREALAALPDALDYDAWVSVGMAIHHETGGDGFHLWDEWSATSPKYTTSDYGMERWESFGRRTDRQVTARSLLKLAAEHGFKLRAVANPEDFDAVAANPIEPEDGPPLRFRVVAASEFAAGEHPGWIMKGVIPRAGVGMLFGESGSGKSFAALDMAMAVARGIPWRGQRVRQGRVVYIAAEGGGGFRSRLQAYAIHHGVDLPDVPFGIVNAAPNMIQKADAVDVLRAIAAADGAALILVDTLAQVTPGANENSAEDMGKALAHCRGIHRATGAMVVLVHHSGKDSSKGARGWSGLRAAADCEIECIRTPGGRLLRVTKQKDGSDTGEWGFDLQVVPVGVDPDGDVVDSCVVVEAPVPVMGRGAVAGRGKPVGACERVVLEVMSEFSLAQSAGIEVDAVLAEVVRRMPVPKDGKRDTRKQVARRALLALCEGDEAPFFLEDGCLSVLI